MVFPYDQPSGGRAGCHNLPLGQPQLVKRHEPALNQTLKTDAQVVAAVTVLREAMGGKAPPNYAQERGCRAPSGAY